MTGIPSRTSSRLIKPAVFVVLSAIVSLGSAASALAPFQAEYRFNIANSVSGTATRELRQQGDTWVYRFSSAIPVIGRASETSTFRLDDKGNVQPLGYQQGFRLLTNSRNINLRFDQAARRVNVQKNRQASQYPLQSGVLDSLNLEVQLRQDLQRTGTPARQYLLAEADGISPVQLTLEGNARIQTPAGSFDTVVIRRLHKNRDRQTRLWLAPSLNYLPVRVQQNDEGTLYTINLNKLRQ